MKKKHLKLRHKKHLIFGSILNIGGAMVICPKCKEKSGRIHFTNQGEMCEKCWQDNKQ